MFSERAPPGIVPVKESNREDKTKWRDMVASKIHARRSYSAIIGKIEPMVIGGRVPSRGFAPYYQVHLALARGS